MNANDPVQRLSTIACREHLTLGGMGMADFALMLGAAALAFDDDKAMSERDVNERLIAWLDTVGAMLASDHVELRRWLVDNGVLARDGYGRVYTRGVPRPEIANAMASLVGHDLRAIVCDARASHAQRREARKAQWSQAR